MFLHSGASLHGHEYSNRPAGNGAAQGMQPRRSPLLRSAFAPPKPRAQQQQQQPSAVVNRPCPSPQQNARSVSEFLPRTPEPVVRFKEPSLTTGTHKASPSEEHTSESELSDTASQSTASRQKRKRRRRAPRTSTNYVLGYPAPKKLASSKMMQKVLPRLLLQLQICENGWPRPVMEVFPSSRISGPVMAPRLAKKFPGILSARRQLAREDLVLIARDDRDGVPSLLDSDEEEKDTLGDDRLLAVFSPLKNSDTAEIVLEDGSVWVATPLPSGSFDFVHIDAHGATTTARWAKRNTPPMTNASTPTSESSPPLDDQPKSRFTFSIINPLSRRHPVMATLNESGLEVQDTYTSVTSSYGRYPPSRSMGRTASLMSTPPSTDDGETEIASPGLERERTTHDIDDVTKTLISVTALWVVLRSGWSPCYTPAVSPESLSQVSRKAPLRSSWAGRPEDLVQRPPGAESPDTTPKLLKRFSAPAPPSRNRSLSPQPALQSSGAMPLAPAGQRILPRRATSTGAAYMQRRMQQSETRGPSQSHLCYHTQLDRETGHSSGDDTAGSSGILGRCPARGRATVATHLLHQVKSPDVLASASISKPVPDATTADQAAAQVINMDDVLGVDETPGKHRGLRGRLSRWIHKLR